MGIKIGVLPIVAGLGTLLGFLLSQGSCAIWRPEEQLDGLCILYHTAGWFLLLLLLT